MTPSYLTEGRIAILSDVDMDAMTYNGSRGWGWPLPAPDIGKSNERRPAVFKTDYPKVAMELRWEA